MLQRHRKRCRGFAALRTTRRVDSHGVLSCRSPTRPPSSRAPPSGIGLAIARAFAKDGANVVINGFGDAAAIEAERAGIEAEFGVKAVYSAADMTKPDEIAAMIAQAEARFGSVDVLVNNAGIQFVAPIEEFPVDKWDAILAINLSAAFHAIRAAVPG